MDGATRQIIDTLQPYRNTKLGANRYNTPWRVNADGPADGGTLVVEPDPAYGLGLKWFDHKDGTAGNGWTLANLLNIQIGGKPAAKESPYQSLTDYAHTHGVDVSVFQDAGWVETKHNGYLCFKFPTATGYRYRYADPAAAGAKYKSELGYTPCWYGLERAVKLAGDGPLIICNGEPSTIAAQHHNVAACCVTGGEKSSFSTEIMSQLQSVWSGPVLIAYDCDVTGRRASKALAGKLRSAGIHAQAIDLRGSDGYDVADFCRLHNGSSASAILSLPTLMETEYTTGEIVVSKQLPLAKDVTPLPETISAAALSIKVFDPLHWTVDGLMPEGACLLAAKPKAKKSWLALATAIAVAMAGKALGHYDVAPGDVLYLDLESNQRRMQSRLKSMIINKAWPENLHFATKWGRGDACLTMIQQWVEQNPNTRLIVIDILARVRPMRDPKADPYEQDYTFLQALNELAETLRITILIIHHTRKSKSADDIFEDVSGTQAITGAVATIWMLTRNQDNPDEQLLHLRGRDLIDEEPLAIKWDAYTCQHIMVASGAEASSTAERRKILDAMDDESEYQVKELASLCGKSMKAIDNLLRRLLDDNAIQRTGRGRYAKIPKLHDPRGLRGLRGFDGESGLRGFDQGEIHTDQGEIHGKSTNPHKSTEGDVDIFSASGSAKPTLKSEIHEIHADSQIVDFWASVPEGKQTVLRLFLRGHKQSDQERARELCEEYGIDYEEAKHHANG
jgi:hypothetical protein